MTLLTGLHTAANRDTVPFRGVPLVLLLLAVICHGLPQFIKTAIVTPTLQDAVIEEILVHAGQHCNWEMLAAADHPADA